MSYEKGTYEFKYLDLCAGIGGFHQAMDALGGTCIGASEINAMCIEVYEHNFKNTPMLGDLNELNDSSDIGSFQVICAGFPCQPFSGSHLSNLTFFFFLFIFIYLGVFSLARFSPGPPRGRGSKTKREENSSSRYWI